MNILRVLTEMKSARNLGGDVMEANFYVKENGYSVLHLRDHNEAGREAVRIANERARFVGNQGMKVEVEAVYTVKPGNGHRLTDKTRTLLTLTLAY